MKKLFNIALIIILTAITVALPCSAIVLDSDYLKAKITEDLNNKYKQNNPDGAVVVKTLPSVAVNLQGTRLVIESICDFNMVGKNKLAKVKFIENGQVLKTITIPVEIKAYDNVLVASKDILKGEPLNSTNTHFEKRLLEENSTNVIAEDFDYSNLTSQKMVKTGEMLDKRFLSKEVAILRSSTVVAIFQSGGIRLSIDVISMENGGIGDYIKVKSKEYNKIYQGKVISSNQVLIQI